LIPTIIFVNGLPCSGKTTLARQIAEELSLPILEKDGIKERLFDTLGWTDLEWSRKLSKASREVLFYILTAEVAAMQSILVECNFVSVYDSPKISEIAIAYPFKAIQILCKADGDILYQRFIRRLTLRHPGHLDNLLENNHEFKTMLLEGNIEPLNIGGEILEVNTSDFETIDYPGIFTQLKGMILSP